MLSWLVAELWGSELVAVHGSVLRPAERSGFLAVRSRRVVGLLTYQLLGDVLEIVTLNAIERRVGIGTMLIDAAADAARHFRCREVRLTTTNDTGAALRFYQRRGFRLAELRPGAVDRSRQEKPQIPRVGDYGIPLHDEIDRPLRVWAARRLTWASLPGTRGERAGTRGEPAGTRGEPAGTRGEP